MPRPTKDHPGKVWCNAYRMHTVEACLSWDKDPIILPRLTARRIAEIRGYVRERRRFQEATRMATEQVNTFDPPGSLWNGMVNAVTSERKRAEVEQRAVWARALHVGEPVSRKSRFWDWFDRAPEWLVLTVLFGASAVVTLLAVVGALYLLGGVL